MRNHSMLGISLIASGLFVALAAGNAFAVPCNNVGDSNCTLLLPVCTSGCGNGVSILPTKQRKDCEPPGGGTQECPRAFLQCGWILTWDNPDCTGGAVLTPATQCACA